MNNDIIAGPWVTESEIELVTQMLRDGLHNYKYVEQAEEAFSDYIGRKYCLLTDCCTDALWLSLISLGIGPGDEVIVPESTWSSTVAPVCHVGATPVFADVGPDWCIDMEGRPISDKVKAIIAVDLYGNMPDWGYLADISNVHGIPIIEDAAEALGGVHKGRKAGDWGKASCFSFHRTKTITTLEGGAWLTDDEELYKIARIHRDLSRDPDNMFKILKPSHKFMPSNFTGAMVLGQLRRIDELIGRKREILHRYKRNMPDLKMNQDDNTVYNGAWATVVEFDQPIAAKVSKVLANQDIPTRPFFYPLSSQPAYSRYAPVLKNKKAYSLAESALVLPSAYHITDSQQDKISEAILSLVHGAFRV